MKRKSKKDIILGFFILVALIIFTSVIYYIGRQNQLFGSEIHITSTFQNVSGLQEGNNVRLSGIKIGVVDHLEIISDTAVRVSMNIEKNAARFIKKDAYAIIESEGLMGNKIITISGGSSSGRGVEEGDHIRSRSPVGIDAAIESFTSAAGDTRELIRQLSDIIEMVKKGNGLLGMIVADTTMEEQMRSLVGNIEQSSNDLAEMVQSLRKTTEQINQGDGLVTKLLYDTAWVANAGQIMDTVSLISRNLGAASKEIRTFTEDLNNRKGSIHKLLTDTVVAGDIEATISNIRDASNDLEGAVQTVENSWILNLFSKKKKQDKKEEKAQKN